MRFTPRGAAAEGLAGGGSKDRGSPSAELLLGGSATQAEPVLPQLATHTAAPPTSQRARGLRNSPAFTRRGYGRRRALLHGWSDRGESCGILPGAAERNEVA